MFPKATKIQSVAVVEQSDGKMQKGSQTENLTMQANGKDIIPKGEEVPSVNGTPSSPKLQLNRRSPVLQRGRSSPCLNKLPNNAIDANKGGVFAFLRRPNLKKADARAVVVDQSGDKTQKAFQTNLTMQALEQEITPKDKKATCINGSPVWLTDPSSPKLYSNRSSPVFQRARSSSCLNKLTNNANDSDNSSDSRAAAVDQSRGKIQALQIEKLTMETFEKEIIPIEKGVSSFNGTQVVQATPSSPKLQSNRCSPVPQRGRSLSCLSRLQNNSNDYDNRNDFTGPGSPQSKSAEARGAKGDSCGDEKKAFQAGKLGCRGTEMLNKNRKISMSLLLKPERDDLSLYQNESGTETDLQENQNRGQTTDSAEIRNRLSIPVNQMQPNRYLSVDDVPFQRGRSAGDIQEALRASTQESQSEFQYSMKAENAKGGNLSMAGWRHLENKPPYESSEQTFLAQGVNSPRMVRRLSSRSRTSSMPKHPESSEEKTFGNMTVFTHKPVKFREITEPLKKSKCFHVLSTIVPLSQTQFQTAMLEIQKQQEQEKVLEGN